MFAESLKEWRKGADLSQAALDARVGMARGFVAQIEVGRLKPPGRSACEDLERALNAALIERDRSPLPEGTVWRIAAPERLEQLDLDLARWHGEEVNRAHGLELRVVPTAPEEELLEQVRRAGDGVAAELAQVMAVVGDQPEERTWNVARTIESAMGVRADRAVLELFRRLHRLHPTSQASAWGTLATVVQSLWRAERARVTSEAETSADGRDEDLVEVGQLPPETVAANWPGNRRG